MLARLGRYYGNTYCGIFGVSGISSYFRLRGKELRLSRSGRLIPVPEDRPVMSAGEDSKT